jgi:hypothetical protein
VGDDLALTEEPIVKRAQTEETPWLAAGLVAGSALVGGVLLAVAAWPSAPTRRRSLPSDVWQTAPTYTEADVEAAARMLASENPRGSRALHIEQVHTQLRARTPGQSLFDRITAGSGWGPQGVRAPGGGVRPVSTAEPATPAFRQLVREVLEGMHPSTLLGARTFFEPVQQDRALAIAERARQKKASRLPLTPQETRLLGYRRSADEVRMRWLADGARYVGTVDGIEFFT